MPEERWNKEIMANASKHIAKHLGILSVELEGRTWMMGESFTMADIGAYVCVDFAGWIKLPVLDQRAHIRRWHGELSARPSASA